MKLPMHEMVAVALVALLAFCGLLDPSIAACGIGFGLSVTHPTATRNSIADLVVDFLDDPGSPTIYGTLVFQTSGGVTVATCTLANPAFGNGGASVAGRADANAITSDTNAVGGTIAKFELRNAAGTARVLGSVTATGGGGDIQLSSVIVSAGQTVAMTSLTYTAPP